MSATLVLNSSYAIIDAYSRDDYQRVIKKVAASKVEVLSVYDDKTLRSWKQAMEAPAVVRFKHYVHVPFKSSKVMQFSRRNIWLRDKCICQYCGCKLQFNEMTWDHVIPKDQGGKSTWLNIVAACLDCNGEKANRTPEQAGMRLLRKPYIPRVSMTRAQQVLLWARNLKQLPHESWARWIYENVPLDEE